DRCDARHRGLLDRDDDEGGLRLASDIVDDAHRYTHFAVLRDQSKALPAQRIRRLSARDHADVRAGLREARRDQSADGPRADDADARGHVRNEGSIPSTTRVSASNTSCPAPKRALNCSESRVHFAWMSSAISITGPI